MVNVTYGNLETGASADSPQINPLGTDFISSIDGTLAAFDPGDTAFVLLCGALIIFMLPGLGYLYSGLTRRKNALTLLFLSILSLAIVSFQWFFIGYSLVFSETGGLFIGDGKNVGFRGVLERAVPETNGKLPEIVFAMYQMCFACLVPAILLGAAAERSRLLPAMLFIFCWTTLVYDFLAHWIWSTNGWAAKWGVLDYAGGVPVEIASGMGGLAYSYFIGRRRGWGTERIIFKPSNVSQVVLGTVLLWVGWLGFNGGSCFAASLKAALAIFNTNLAGSTGAITWLIMDFRLERKWSVVGFCTGAIAGLVAITPAAGLVGAPAAALIGVVSAAVSNLSTRLKNTMRVDDPMDIFSVHALAGIVGTLMTGLFAQSSVAANDGFSAIGGGWLDRNWIQLAKQLAWVSVGCGWTFVVTYLIMFVINLIPGCKFRSTEEAEIVGMDEVELGEYVADYAYHERDLEGNYEPMSTLPSRAPSPLRGPPKMSSQSSPEVVPVKTGSEYTSQQSSTLRSSTQISDNTAPSQSQSRTRSRSRGRRVRHDTDGEDEEVEMVDVDLAALHRAEAKIAAQQEEYLRRIEMSKDR